METMIGTEIAVEISVASRQRFVTPIHRGVGIDVLRRRQRGEHGHQQYVRGVGSKGQQHRGNGQVGKQFERIRNGPFDLQAERGEGRGDVAEFRIAMPTGAITAACDRFSSSAARRSLRELPARQQSFTVPRPRNAGRSPGQRT